MNNEYHSKSVADTYKELKTSKDGLTKTEVKIRYEKYGKNALPKKKTDPFIVMFFKEMNSPLVYILIVTMILSFITGEIVDGFFILFVIVLDAFLGAIQEWKSTKNAEALENLIKIEAVVLRDGEKIAINSEELVPGDIVYLESGTRVPADIRLIETQNLSIDESVLTGETITKDKHTKVLKESIPLSERDNMAYIGSSVMRGRGIGVVIGTGLNTEIGKIAETVLKADDTPSTLTIKMKKFTDALSILTLVIAIVLTIILYIKDYTFKEIFFSVIALSVSAIPEGLPVALTLSLSIASSRMAKKNVLVKKLKSVESLGSTTLIASDKTGTLTLNEQTAKEIYLPDGKHFEIDGIGYNGIGKIKKINNAPLAYAKEIIHLGAINNEATLELVNDEWISHGDGMDIAFLAAAYKAELEVSTIKDENVGIIPYESETKYSGVFYKEKDEVYFTAKGSVEKLLEFSSKMLVNGKEVKIDKEQIQELNKKMASNGYRVLAVAKGKTTKFKQKDTYKEADIPSLTLLGLVGFIDPIREETIDAIKKCQEAGIKTVMITGDHPLTAFHIAKELHMVSNFDEVATSDEIDDKLSEGYEAFDKYVRDIKVFSRVTPIQKYEIVESYKRQGEYVAVTGDGVNDAPALKAANVGIAMGSGTDVAKETGAMIITDDNFSTIVNGIEEGRTAYSNIRKVSYMLLSCAVSEVLFFMLAILLDYELPLLAIQLLWLNLVTDGIQDAALSFEMSEPDVMKKKPKGPKESLFDKIFIKETLLAGFIMSVIVILYWAVLIDVLHVDIAEARGEILLLMVFIQNFHVFNCRSERRSIFKMPIKKNKLLVVGICAILFLQFVVSETPTLASILGTTPLTLSSILYALILACPILICMEVFKYFERKEKQY